MGAARLDGIALAKVKHMMFKVAQGRAEEYELEIMKKCGRLAWEAMCKGGAFSPTPFAYTVWFYSYLYCSVNNCRVDEGVVRGIAKWVSEHSNLLCDPELMFSAAVDVMNGTEEAISTARNAALENSRVLEQAGRNLERSQGREAKKVKSIVDELIAENERLLVRLKAAQEQLVKMKEAVDVLKKQIEVDALTQVMNRRGFDERIQAVVKASQMTKVPVSLIMIDVDHFKRVNDTYGHKAGDAVLYHVAQLLKGVICPPFLNT